MFFKYLCGKTSDNGDVRRAGKFMKMYIYQSHTMYFYPLIWHLETPSHFGGFY